MGHKTNECLVKLQEVAEDNKGNGEEEGFVDESALEVDKSWSIGCVDGCCSKPGVGAVKRRKDKRGRRWSTLNLTGAFKEGVEVRNRFEVLSEEAEEEG